MDTFAIFEALLSDNGRLAKEKVMTDNIDNTLFKRVCYLALNPYIKFYVRRIPKTFAGLGTMDLSTALDSLTKLSERELTGNAAVNYLADLFNSLSERDAQVLKKVIDKDLKCGVSTSTVNKIWPDLIPRFELQFAEPWNEKKIAKRFSAEPKIDGMRCVVVCDEKGEFTFYSRGGREIETLDHLKDDLLKLNNNMFGWMLDAEAKSGDFESSLSAIKRLGKNAKSDAIYLFVFDYMTFDDWTRQECKYTYDERRAQLEKLFENDQSEFIILNESTPWDEEGDPKDWIDTWFAKKRAEKYEGLILKNRDGLYAFERNFDWMKVKPFETTDVEITGAFEGTGRNKGRLGGFFFEVEGRVCRVGGGFSDKEREEFWAIRNEMTGEIIEIEFMEKTSKGSTRHCNFIARRGFKGEKA